MVFTVWSVEVSSTELTLDRIGLFDDDFGFLHTREKWFCRPQLLQVLPLAIHLTLWLADQVKPQFLQSWFGGRLKLDVVGRWLGVQKDRWWITALSCGAYCEFVICSWFLWPNSIFMAKRNAWADSRVSRNNSRWISGSNIFAINKSLIWVSSWLPSSQFSESSFIFPKKCSIDSPLVCFVVRSTYLSNVILRWRINAASMIVQSFAVVRLSILRCGFWLQTILRPSVPKLRYSIDTVFRSACAHGLSPHIIPISSCLWHRFSQFIFDWAFLANLSLSDCADDPVIVSS